MLENLQKVQKVWFSFVKFVKNQVTVNGRLVDTQLIGYFLRDNTDGGNVVFMPSPEYLEAGKFRLSRTSTGRESETAGDLSPDQYSERYSQQLKSTGKGELC